MRDAANDAALPRAPDRGRAREERRIVVDGVRCPTPGCGRKLAEALRGTLVIRCDRCRHEVTIARP